MTQRTLIRHITNEIRAIEAVVRAAYVMSSGLEDELAALCAAAGSTCPDFSSLTDSLTVATAKADAMHVELNDLATAGGESTTDHLGAALGGEDVLMVPQGGGGK